MRINRGVIAFLMSIALLSGCSSTAEKDASLLDKDASVVDGDVSTQGYSNGSGVSGEQFGSDSRFSDPANPLSKKVIYFMFDSSQVQPEFTQVIAAHAQYIVSHPAARIVLEGHADERGSPEYNIALGELRGKAVLRMMKMQGVSDSQIEVVSYGEEKPASKGMDESAWSLNRRVAIVY